MEKENTGLKRITPERVVAAYKATRLKPIQDTWAILEYSQTTEQETACACGLSAIMLNDKKSTFDILCDDTVDPSEIATTGLELSVPYVIGFTSGFDGDTFHAYFSKTDDNHPEYNMGFEDGKAAWDRVVSEGIVEQNVSEGTI